MEKGQPLAHVLQEKSFFFKKKIFEKNCYLRGSSMEKGQPLADVLQEGNDDFALERHCVVVYQVV
jgi:hypothetical protein